MTSRDDQQLRYWPTDKAWAATGQTPPTGLADADRDTWKDDDQ